MSLYLVDRFIYQVDAHPDWGARYLDDPAGFLEWWEREEAGKVTHAESVGGHELTDAERKALIARDIETLYTMGAHPFLLFTWLLPILEGEHRDFPSLLEHYGEAIAEHGRPSWRT